MSDQSEMTPTTSAAPTLDICGGHGGLIYEYVDPEWRSQWVGEPCDRCNGWHEDQRPAMRVPHGPKIGPIRRWRRRP